MIIWKEQCASITVHCGLMAVKQCAFSVDSDIFTLRDITDTVFPEFLGRGKGGWGGVVIVFLLKLEMSLHLWQEIMPCFITALSLTTETYIMLPATMTTTVLMPLHQYR